MLLYDPKKSELEKIWNTYPLLQEVVALDFNIFLKKFDKNHVLPVSPEEVKKFFFTAWSHVTVSYLYKIRAEFKAK